MKSIMRVVAFALAFTLAFNTVLIGCTNANAVKISPKTISMYVGDTYIVKLKGNKKKVKWSLSNSKAKLSKKAKKKCLITAVKKGNVKLTAKIGKKKYVCKIKISQYVAPAATTVDDHICTTTEYAINYSTTEANATVQNTTTAQAATTTTATTTTSAATTTAAATTEKKASSGTTENAGEYSLESKHKGEGTFYDRTSTGAANLDEYESKYLTCAMQTSDYMNNMAGAYIEITDKDGDKVKVLVTDRLPEGKKGDIDLTRKAFKTIEPEVTGRMKISWKIIALPTDEPISYRFKPTSSEWWAEIQVRNHRYPIKSLEYLDNNTGKYVKLERQEYNYFTAPSGMGKGPYTFRVTDIYGRKLIDKNISISKKDIKGSKNFPII